MKTLKFILAYCIMAVNCFSQDPRFANEILKEAFLKAQNENKNVFVKFSASWCGWCKKMDASMGDPVCKKLFDDNFITVKLIVDETGNNKNLENPGADSVRIQYNGDKNTGLPFWFILDAKGSMLSDCYIHKTEANGIEKKSMIGCPATEEEVIAFVEVLKRTTKLSNHQLQIISERFRENDVKGH